MEFETKGNSCRAHGKDIHSREFYLEQYPGASIDTRLGFGMDSVGAKLILDPKTAKKLGEALCKWATDRIHAEPPVA